VIVWSFDSMGDIASCSVMERYRESIMPAIFCCLRDPPYCALQLDENAMAVGDDGGSLKVCVYIL